MTDQPHPHSGDARDELVEDRATGLPLGDRSALDAVDLGPDTPLATALAGNKRGPVVPDPDAQRPDVLDPHGDAAVDAADSVDEQRATEADLVAAREMLADGEVPQEVQAEREVLADMPGTVEPVAEDAVVPVAGTEVGEAPAGGAPDDDHGVPAEASAVAPAPPGEPAPAAATPVASDEAAPGGTAAPGMAAVAPAGGVPAGGPGTATVADVEEALHDVVDPELGINIVDLGLVYGVTVDSHSHAVIDMTLTSAACPLTDVIEDQVATALEGLVNGHRLNWVWMPPWGPEKITESGREQLRALGFNI